MAMRLLTLGTSEADSGTMPVVGNTIYGVADDGTVRWYKYLGNGESNPAPGTVGWHPHSGNAILHAPDGQSGWTWFQLGTGGKMVAIDVHGDLYWWSYGGDGTGVDSGRAGWDQGSGTRIAQGWGDYAHVMMFYNSGDEVILLTVDGNGVMVPHAYSSSGGWDRSFTNPVPGDWRGFTRLIATTSTIFGVKADGTLHRYQPTWTLNPVVWTEDAHWGNQIATGWGAFRQLAVGGLDDPASQSHPTFVGVDATGGLRWYRYTGTGSGAATDWAPNSGNAINGSW
jgi:hypothetical protein